MRDNALGGIQDGCYFPQPCVNLNSQPLRLFVERSPITSNGTAGSGSEPYGAAVHLDRVTSPRDQPAEYAVDPLVGPLPDRQPGSLPGCGRAREGRCLCGHLGGFRGRAGVAACRPAGEDKPVDERIHEHALGVGAGTLQCAEKALQTFAELRAGDPDDPRDVLELFRPVTVSPTLPPFPPPKASRPLRELPSTWLSERGSEAIVREHPFTRAVPRVRCSRSSGEFRRWSETL